MSAIGDRINDACRAAKLSQRALGRATGVPQATLSRIISGDRPVQTPELAAIAEATGTTIAELTGRSTVAGRAQCVARASDESDMAGMRRELLHMLELNAYLEDQAIPAVGR